MIVIIIFTLARLTLVTAKKLGEGSADACCPGYAPENLAPYPILLQPLPPTNTDLQATAQIAQQVEISEQPTIQPTRTRLFNKRILAACNPPTIGCLDCVNNTVNCTNCSTVYWLSTTVMKQECILCNQTHSTFCNSCNQSVCLTCDANRTIDPANHSNCICPQGTFWNSSSCLPCIDSCLECSDNSTCITCKTGYSLIGNNFCQPCTPNCFDCNNATSCLTCEANFMFNTLDPTRIGCMLCPDGQFLQTDGSCQLCDPKCLKCSETPTKCTDCHPGHTLIKEIFKCRTANCADGQYYDTATDTCKPCNAAFCKKCSGPLANQCYECADGFFKNRYNPPYPGIAQGQCASKTINCTITQFRNFLGNCQDYTQMIVSSRYFPRAVHRIPPWHVQSPQGNATRLKGICGIGSPTSWATCFDCNAPSYVNISIAGLVPTCALSTMNQGYVNFSYDTKLSTPGVFCRFETSSGTGTCVSCLAKTFFNSNNFTCQSACKSDSVFNPATQTCMFFDANCEARDAKDLCTKCSDHSTLNTTNNLCIPCHLSCMSCSGPAANECTTCSPGFQQLSPGVCTMRCPTGFYWDLVSTSCQQASPTCKTADNSPTKCTSCPGSYILDVDKCERKSCSAGQYFSLLTQNCEVCHSSCSTCTAAGANGCSSCPEGSTFDYLLKSCSTFVCHATCNTCYGPRADQCKDTPPITYLSYNNLVLPYYRLCPESHYLQFSTDTCLPCDPACYACEGPARTQCRICSSGYIRWNGACVLNQESCLLQNSQTITTTNSDTCEACTDSNCLSCEVKTVCDFCKNGFHPFNGVCVPCSTNTLYCQQYFKNYGYSLACKAGYMISYTTNCSRICAGNEYHNIFGSCIPCNSSCRTCYGQGSKCDSCWKGDQFFGTESCSILKNTDLGAYYLNAANEAVRCNLPCDTCEINNGGSCTSCIPGYYLAGSSCLRCDPVCLTCVTTESTCTSCHMGYTYQSATNTCAQICEPYEYFDTALQVCMLCPPNCRTCSWSNPDTCNSCHDGFMLLSGRCERCHETCRTCTIPAAIDKCLTCRFGLSLLAGKCQKSCINRSYLNLSRYDCFLCNKHCLNCAGPSQYNCTSCFAGYTLVPNAPASTDDPSITSGFCRQSCTSFELYYGPIPNDCRPCYSTCATCSGHTNDSCLTCRDGYYLVGGSCFKCDPACSSCTGPTKFDCATCPLGTYKDSNGYCKRDCLIFGTILDYGLNECVPCHLTCKTCTNTTADTCLTCSDGYPLMLYNNTCISACPVGTFYNATEKKCLLCHPTCGHCQTDALETSCTACPVASPVQYIQLNGTCRTGCQGASYPPAAPNLSCLPCNGACTTCSGPLFNNCLSCPGTLNLQLDFTCAAGCPAHYFSNPLRVCQTCHSDCGNCSGASSSNCDTCISPKPLKLYNSTCIANCPSSYFYKVSSLDCVPCFVTCLECTSALDTACTTCPPNYFKQLNGSCRLSCEGSSFLPSGAIACQACDPNCARCSGPSSSQCLSCFPGKILQPDLTCFSSCPSSYFANPIAVCQLCHSDCATCLNETASSCTSCSSAKPKLLYNKTCIAACPLDTFYESSIPNCTKCHSSCGECREKLNTDCTKCKNAGEYIQIDGTCQIGCAIKSFAMTPSSIGCTACHSSCSRCNGTNSNQCLSCLPGFHLQPTYTCGIGCPAGFFPSIEGFCVVCHMNCLTCRNSSINGCITCNSDRWPRSDGKCVKKCSQGFFYNDYSDTCEKCHSDCQECSAGSGYDCISCVFGKFKHIDNRCVDACPPGFYVKDGSKCDRCALHCSNCTGPAISSCQGCGSSFVMLKNYVCETECEAFQYEFGEPKKCEDCHKTCKSCEGPTDRDCIECKDKISSVLNDAGQCINCLENPDQDSKACHFSVAIQIVQPSDSLLNPNASISVRIVFQNDTKYLSRLTENIYRESLKIKVSVFDSADYTYEFVKRQGQFILDLYFRKSLTDMAKLVIAPIKDVILKNRITGANELIFRRTPASLDIAVIEAPDLQIVASLSSTVASSAKISGSASAISSGLSLVALVSSSGFGAPLMKFFKIFKLVSRLRLINIDFGTYLELFLSFCNSIFRIGGDKIDREALLANPNSRGKLNKYKVTVLSTNEIPLQYAVYWIILMARLCRNKFRKYVSSKEDLNLTEKLLTTVAESGRVLLLTLIGIDVFFYSLHCVAHIDQIGPLGFSGKASFWLSGTTIVFIVLDFLMMIAENSATTFMTLRIKMRKERMLNPAPKKDALEATKDGPSPLLSMPAATQPPLIFPDTKLQESTKEDRKKRLDKTIARINQTTSVGPLTSKRLFT